jgi:hypothetical protein
MHSVLALGIAAAIVGIPLSPPQSAPDACYVAAITVVIDDVKDVREVKYHRVVVSGIRRLEPSPDALDESCEPKDGAVAALLRQSTEARLQGVLLKAPQIRLTYTIRHSSVDGVRQEIKRFAAVARLHSGTFTRVEVVELDVPDAPRSDALPLPTLSTSGNEAESCSSDNKTLERAGAKYRWLC